ncbi:MAG TPA: sialidase family protein [Chloroflexota bacterium]
MQRIGCRIGLVLVLIACTLVGASVDAATPASGTVSPVSPSVTYVGGPFVVANVTGAAADDPLCSAATPCDDFALTVSVPANFNSTNDVRITVNWPTSAADFDVYVYDSAGVLATSAASSSDPEIAVLPAIAGVYVVRVVPFAPLGQSYAAIVELTPKGSTPTPSTRRAPRYQNYAAPDGLGGSAGEPSIGANWTTGKVLFQALTETLRVTFDDSASPPTATWRDKSARPPNCTAATSLDPILFTDEETGRTFESQLIANPAINSLTCFTDDDGDTWTPSEGGGIGSGVDHQTIGGGHFAANGIGPLTEYPNSIVYCSQDVGDALCSVSRDGGLTFSPAVPIYTVTQCGGLHGHVKVGPTGSIYVPNKGCGGHQAVVVSEDNGLHWAVRPVPSSLPHRSDPSVGIGTGGTAYFGYANADGHPRAAVSHDHGQTWSNDQDVGAAFALQNVVFPAVVAGDDDRAAFAFLGTTTAGDYQADNFSGVWHLYVAHTFDGGRTWVTSDGTPTDPVQVGCIWLGGGSNPCRNLLDFMDATVDADGRVLVGYADGCTLACASAPEAKTDAANGYRTKLATIARETTGRKLFARSS